VKIVVSGLIGSYPLGGVAWDYLQFVKGFVALGCEVTYLEDTGQWAYDPRTGTFGEDASHNVRYLAEVLARVPGMERSFAFRDPKGVVHGIGEEELARRCREADLFLNVSGAAYFRDEYRAARVCAYYDSDPLYTQAGVAAFDESGGSEDEARSVGWFRAHDVYFTMAESIHDPSCAIPRCGVEWKTTRQPITLDDWPVAFDANATRLTTVMSWKTKPALPVVGGRTYGGKDVELRRFLDLPRRVRTPLEIAVSGPAPKDELVRAGWSLVDAAERSTTMEVYRDYIGRSRGEWSVAKEAYAATGSGWFSCRSACYLAMGKPVIVEDTGFSQHYPVGEGLFAFSDLGGAVRAIDALESDYRRHVDAARAIAERFFAAETVLEKLLYDAGL
jgi:hypothetical protein